MSQESLFVEINYLGSKETSHIFKKLFWLPAIGESLSFCGATSKVLQGKKENRDTAG